MSGGCCMKTLTFFLALVSCVFQLSACTGLLTVASDRSTVNGRTVEFGIDLDMSVAVVPRGYAFVGKTPSGSGLAYKAKYAAAGIYCFDSPVLMDGINEKGLVAAAFYFPGYASYAKMSASNQSRGLSPVDFTNWILTQFATLEEVKAGIKSVVIAPTVLENWGSTPPPFHYIVYDKSGRSIVIEPIDGALVVYENDLGVITNSPTFDWHITNLGNYVNLTPYNVGALTLRNLTAQGFGQGSGMLGLPGDFTPPSRFVRATFFSVAALPSKDSSEAVDQTFHILNQFDIPLGSVRQKEQGATSYDYTQLTSVKDPQTLEYFFRSYDNEAIEYVNLSHFDLNSKEIKAMRVQGKQSKFDVSSKLR